MKTLFFTIIGFFAAFTYASGQGTPANLPTDISGTIQTVSATSTKNYILTYSYLQPLSGHPDTLTTGAANPVIQYFNGLGDPEETVLVKSTQLGNDLVSYQSYDNFRRPEISYLPYGKSSNNGAYVSKTSFISDQNTFLSGIYGSADGSKGYSQTDYEESPLNRILKQGAPGHDWQISTHPVSFDYNTNLSAETVQTWKYTGESYSLFNYPSGRLYVKITTDEDGKVVKEYIDYAGKIVQIEMNGAKTRYCYDEFGRLKCVVQPEGSSPASTDNCFYYKYDERSRLTERTMPAKVKEYYIYDSHDRVVLTQDSVQRAKKPEPEWSYTRYDNLNRPVEQGTWVTATSRTLLKTYIDSNLDYMSGVSNRVILKYLYYNNYTGKPSYGSDITSLGITLATNNIGRLTWIKTKALDYESGMDYWLEQTIYYDRYGRVVHEVRDNHLNGVDYITNVYNFTGQIVQTRYRHTADGTTTYTDQYNDYDHRGRIIKVRHRINGANEVLLAGSNYNEAGELVDKYLHSVSGGTFLQCNDYLYNFRGWLTDINSPTSFSENDKFGLKLYYNSAPTGGAATYNGNISGMGWGSVANSNMLYRFSYDGNNRLSSADFYKNGIAANGFDVNYTYDKNGNIKTLNRYSISGTYIDQLTYQYSGNKITGLKDASGDIANTVDYPGSTAFLSFNYDGNGNVTGEPHKQITITYNLLNLPWAINLNGQNKSIFYYYTFDGSKLRETVENNGVISKTDYCGPFVYETVSGTRSLKYIISPEGRVVKNGSNWDYEYHLTDHLGNVRIVIHKGSNGLAEVVQERHYYPFGMEMSTLSSGTSTNKYLFNGKEYENNFDLGWYDYGARFYDPQIGRWHVVDPKAEKYTSTSHYAYCINNPTRFLDPNGKEICIYYNDERQKEHRKTYILKRSHNGKNESIAKSHHYVNPISDTRGGTMSGELTGSSNSFNFKNGLPSDNKDKVSVKPDALSFEEPAGQGDGGRMYGGDGSGSVLDWTCRVADVLNQFNPIANLWDYGTYLAKGTDRFGNKMSVTEGTLKAASIIPIGKIGSLGANAIKITGFTEHGLNQLITRGFTAPNVLTIMKQGTAVETMGRYGMQIRYTLGGNTVIVNSSGKVVTAFSTAADGVFIPF